MARFRLIVGGAVLAWAGALLAGCTTNKATGRSQFDVLSRQDEIALGEQAMPELVDGYGGAVSDPALGAYVRRVGMSIVEQTEGDYRSLPWEFTLLNSDVINAFALPGGKVFVSRALAEKFTNEAQLAGVLGHEVGHVTAEHADQGVARQIGLSALAIGLGVAAGSDEGMQLAVGAVVSGAGVYALSFDRDQEIEADKLGMRYMTGAGYNPKGMLQLMQVLQRASQGGGRQPEWLSTHPLPETRIRIIEDRLKKEKYAAAPPGAVTSGDDGFFQSRFQREFLEPLDRLPPATSRQSRLDLSRPELWCALCAAGRGLGHEMGTGTRN
ncbi:MAG TPA: peptidase M48 Ste24p [Phycisphaerales bacterium]|nr:peptidase M48 Ste24p [Phycisphaerales bacterium]